VQDKPGALCAKNLYAKNLYVGPRIRQTAGYREEQQMTTGPWIKTTCAVALLGAVLTGCGRKGDLERPNIASAPAGTAQETTPAAPVKERSFILDGLLE